jgi:hypothetical protein
VHKPETWVANASTPGERARPVHSQHPGGALEESLSFPRRLDSHASWGTNVCMQVVYTPPPYAHRQSQRLLSLPLSMCTLLSYRPHESLVICAVLCAHFGVHGGSPPLLYCRRCFRSWVYLFITSQTQQNRRS